MTLLSDPQAELPESEDRAAVLAAQKEIIDAQKDLLISQKELLAAKFPAIAGGKEGSIDIKEGGIDPFHARVRAYKALERAVDKLCSVAKGAGNTHKVFAVIAADDIKAAGQYRIAVAEAERIGNAYDEASKPGSGSQGQGFADAAGAAVVLTSIVELMKLFRANRTLYNEVTDIQPDELSDLIVKKLKENSSGQNYTVHYPAAEVEGVIASGKSAFMESLKTLETTRGEADAEILRIESMKPRPLPEAAKLRYLKVAVARHDKLVAALAAVEVSVPALFHVLRGEIVASAMARAGTLVLMARLAKQGGVSMTSSHAMRSDKLYSSGGVVVSYRLMVDGQFKDAGNVTAEEPFEEVRLS